MSFEHIGALQAPVRRPIPKSRVLDGTRAIASKRRTRIRGQYREDVWASTGLSSSFSGLSCGTEQISHNSTTQYVEVLVGLGGRMGTDVR